MLRCASFVLGLFSKITRAKVFIGVAGAVLAVISVQSVHATAGINEQLNYQARLLQSTGAIVPDGTYNLEFKIYQDGDGDLGGGDETLKWTETRTGADKVTVVNGYFSVQLGSVTAFASSVDWNQDTLWLSVNVGGTGSPSWDGEMDPFRRLSATAYALNAKQLGGLDWSKFVQIAPSAVQTDSSTLSTLYLNKTGASGNILELEKNGSDVFVIGNTGAVTFLPGAANEIFVDGGTTDRTADLLHLDVDVNSASVDGLYLDLDVGTALSAAEIANGLNIDVTGLAGDDAGSFLNGINLNGDVTSAGTVRGLNFAGSFDTGIDLSDAATTTDLILDDGLTMAQTSDADLDIVEGGLTLNIDFAETTASTVTANSASNIEWESTANSAAALKLESTAGGIDIFASGAAAGEDIDIVATGSSVNITSTEASADAILLTASGGTTSTIHLTSNGTGTAAIDIDATGSGGDIDVDANDAITLDAATMTFTLAAGTTDFTVAGLDADSNIIFSGMDVDANAILYTTTGGVVTRVAETETGSQCLLSGAGASGVPTWGSCPGGGGTWDTVGDPAGDGAINFASTEQTMDWTDFNDQDLDGMTFNFDNNGGTAGMDNGIVINNSVSTNSTGDLNTEALLLLQQLDTTASGTTVVDNAMKIDVAADGGMADGIEITNSAGNLTNAINIVDTGGGTLATGINLSGTLATGVVGGATFTTAIDLSSGSSTTDLILDDGLTMAQTSDADLDIVEGGLTLNLDFAETTASTITATTASDIEWESSANSAASVKLESTAGGIDIFASGAAAGEDIDIVATGSSVNVSSTEAANNAVVLDASSNTGGVRIIAGDNEASSTANGNDIELMPEDDLIISLTSGGQITIGAADTTGSLLVLDDKTGSGDPTGVEGGMYYNSNRDRMRCYEGTMWFDCVGAGGIIANVETTTQQTGMTADTDLTSMSLTPSLRAGHTYRITGQVGFSSNAADDVAGLEIRETTLPLRLQVCNTHLRIANTAGTVYCSLVYTAGADGTLSLRLRFIEVTAGTYATDANTFSPIRFWVEDIGVLP